MYLFKRTQNDLIMSQRLLLVHIFATNPNWVPLLFLNIFDIIKWIRCYDSRILLLTALKQKAQHGLFGQMKMRFPLIVKKSQICVDIVCQRLTQPSLYGKLLGLHILNSEQCDKWYRYARSCKRATMSSRRFIVMKMWTDMLKIKYMC